MYFVRHLNANTHCQRFRHTISMFKSHKKTDKMHDFLPSFPTLRINAWAAQQVALKLHVDDSEDCYIMVIYKLKDEMCEDKIYWLKC